MEILDEIVDSDITVIVPHLKTIIEFCLRVMNINIHTHMHTHTHTHTYTNTHIYINIHKTHLKKT